MPRHHQPHHKSDRPRSTEKPQQRRHLQRKAKRTSMNTTPADDPMDIDSGVTEGSAPSNNHTEQEREDDAAEGFEVIHHVAEESVAESTNPQISEGQPPPLPDKISEITAPQVPEKDSMTAAHTNEPKQMDLQQEFEKLRMEQAKQIEALQIKFKRLESENQRTPVTEDGNKIEEGGELKVQERERYEEQFRKLMGARMEMEQQIKDLIDIQEATSKHQSEIERQYREALAHIDKEKRAREEAELDLRSEVGKYNGLFRKEKERAQKLMKTMAEMQSADPYKLDNNNITSSVKELRYSIRNWAYSQRLVLSPPQPGIVSYVHQKISGNQRGPNYDFLSAVTPLYHEYTSNHQDFRYLLQAYVWKRISEMVFGDDMWAGTRKALDDEETEYRMVLGHRSMKSRLQPDENASKEYIATFHEWRSITARLLDKRISTERRKRTVEIVRDEILKPLLTAAEEQEIQNIEDFDSIIEGAMRLATSMAQQRAYFEFEYLALAAYTKLEFVKGMMTDIFSPEPYDPQTHFRAVVLTIAPRLLKHGTSEGTNFEAITQLIEAEVDTRIMRRKFVGRRPIQ